MKRIRLKIAIVVLGVLTGCQASNFQRPSTFGHPIPQKNKPIDEQKADVIACRDLAQSSTNTDGNLALRVGVTLIPFLNSPSNALLDNADIKKQRAIFKECMNAKGYEVIPADDDVSAANYAGIQPPKSQVKVTLPSGWIEGKVTPRMAYGNVFYYGLNKSKDLGMQISTAKLGEIKDVKQLAVSLRQNQMNLLTDVVATEIDSFNVNGHSALQFEVTGNAKTGYRQRFTYFFSIFEGKEEFVYINFFSSDNDYQKNKGEFMKMLGTISGL